MWLQVVLGSCLLFDPVLSFFFDLREMGISVTCFSELVILLNVFGPKSTFVLFVFKLKKQFGSID